MKPFNLERALAGDPVVTRGGWKALKILDSGLDIHMRYIALFEDGSTETYDEHGRYFGTDEEAYIDLFMAPKKRKVWVNFYAAGGADWFETEELAKSKSSKYYIAIAVPVEIEE